MIDDNDNPLPDLARAISQGEYDDWTLLPKVTLETWEDHDGDGNLVATRLALSPQSFKTLTDHKERGRCAAKLLDTVLRQERLHGQRQRQIGG